MADPVKVSPLIKVARYSMLTLGILYGSSRQVINKMNEDAIRAKEEEERPAREAAMKADKARKYQEEMAYLARETGVSGSGSGKSGGGDGGASGDPLQDCGCGRF